MASSLRTPLVGSMEMYTVRSVCMAGMAASGCSTTASIESSVKHRDRLDEISPIASVRNMSSEPPSRNLTSFWRVSLFHGGSKSIRCEHCADSPLRRHSLRNTR